MNPVTTRTRAGQVATGFREAVLRSCGATDAVMAELLAYTENVFRLEVDASSPAPGDEAHVPVWASYLAGCEEVGVFERLRRSLIQLRFPVREGISRLPEYQAATRRGIRPPDDAEGVRLERPGDLRLLLHETGAGRVPVLVPGSRADFETLVRALASRNEPVDVPDAMGACLVTGYNNWDRVERWVGARMAEAASRGEVVDRSAALRELIPRRTLYQDRFIILSTGDYSATAASDVGVPPGQWRETSFRLRLEHECTHYFTLRALGSARNALHDELIADYIAIVSVAGRFRKDWLLRFLGLDHSDRLRDGARLCRYRGKPPLSDSAFQVLQRLVRRAAGNLERIDRSCPPGSLGAQDRALRIIALARIGLESLAADTAEEAWARAVGDAAS